MDKWLSRVALDFLRRLTCMCFVKWEELIFCRVRTGQDLIAIVVYILKPTPPQIFQDPKSRLATVRIDRRFMQSCQSVDTADLWSNWSYNRKRRIYELCYNNEHETADSCSLMARRHHPGNGEDSPSIRPKWNVRSWAPRRCIDRDYPLIHQPHITQNLHYR